MKLAKRKLDVIGHIKPHSQPLNDGKRMKRLENCHQLAESLASIACRERAAEEAGRTKSTEDLRKATPAAMSKLIDKGRDASKLFKTEIVAMLIVFCDDAEDENKLIKMTKGSLVERLAAAVERDPSKIARQEEAGENGQRD